MARYTDESKERLREAVDMIAVVETRTELRRAGANSYVGLCPFHDERTPSFSVNPVDKVYYCFGCQAKGDVFRFIEDTEGVDFKGALELLADRFGVELEVEAEDPRDAERRQRRERLLELVERTTAYYERYLWESKEAEPARRYLAERGLGEEILRQFRVGYAPSAWDRVLLASRQGGFSNRDVYDVGLAQRSQKSGKLYDRFRRRIMFPLADVRGRVLGFGARALGPDQQPKYVNTAEGELYHKGRHLFGAHLARAHATRAGVVVVCEGYTDVIALHQAGLRNAVGIMGTAVTEDQVGELAKLASTVALALDADSAGQEAMLRAAKVAAGRSLELRVVPMPADSDPADLVAREGAEAMASRVDGAVALVRFRVERVLAQARVDTAEGKDRALAELRPVMEVLAPSALREDLIRQIADRLALPASLVARLVGDGGGTAGRAASTTGGEGRREHGGGARTGDRARLDRREQTERTFLALCVALPELGRDALARVDVDEHFTGEVVRRAARHLRDHLDAPTAGVPAEDPELAALLAEIAVRAAHEPAEPATLEVETLQLELARIERQIATARAVGAGEGGVAELAARRAALKGEVDKAIDRAMDGAARVE
jgi:DNA primase